MNTTMGDLQAAIKDLLDLDLERSEIAKEPNWDKVYDWTARHNKAMSNLRDQYSLYFVEIDDDEAFWEWRTETTNR